MLSHLDLEPYVEPAGVRIASFCLRWFIFALLGADALLFVVAVRGPH